MRGRAPPAAKGTKPSTNFPNCNNKPWTRRTSNLAAFRPILLLFLLSSFSNYTGALSR